MSGRKYSQVELANNVREAIRCRLLAEDAFARADCMVVALAEAARATESLKTLASSAQDALTAIGQQLRSMKDNFSESRLMSVTLGQVQEQRREVDHFRSQLEQIIQKCREGNHAASLRAELVAVLDFMQKNRNNIEPWLSDVYGEFTEGIRSLIKLADQEISSARITRSAEENILQRIMEHDKLMEKVTQRRAMDADRQYTARALEKVCTELGFSPKVLPQKGPMEDLVLEVDTYAYGIIHFRLQLDGTIRSQSELIEASCSSNFAKIEDKLRELGVISGFRYEGDQQPVRLRKGEKSFPTSEPGAALKRNL
jgi:hypothetical protein